MFSSFSWIIVDAFDDRAEIVRWIAESKRPFSIVNDRGFQSLMKTGRPGYHIPSDITISRDVRKVFLRVRSRIAKVLQVYFKLLLKSWTYYFHRTTMATSILQRTPGPLQIIRPSLLSPFIWSTKESQYRCS